MYSLDYRLVSQMYSLHYQLRLSTPLHRFITNVKLGLSTQDIFITNVQLRLSTQEILSHVYSWLDSTDCITNVLHYLLHRFHHKCKAWIITQDVQLRLSTPQLGLSFTTVQLRLSTPQIYSHMYILDYLLHRLYQKCTA